MNTDTIKLVLWVASDQDPPRACFERGLDEAYSELSAWVDREWGKSFTTEGLIVYHSAIDTDLKGRHD